MNDYISYSQIVQMHKCPRSYYYSNVKCMYPIKQKTSLTLGKLIHIGLEELYKEPMYTIVNLNNALKRINRELEIVDKSNWNENDFYNNRYISAMSKALISYYYETKYQEDKAFGVKVIETEIKREVSIPFPNNNKKSKWKYVFIPDKVIEVKGKLWLVSIKTAGKLQEADINKYYVDQQALTELMFLEKEYGRKFEGIIYQIIIKPQIKPKQIPKLDDDGIKVVIDANGERVFKKDGKPRESADKEAGYMLVTREETESEFTERLIETIKESDDSFIRTLHRRVTEDDLDSCKKDLWNNNKYIITAKKNKWYQKNTNSCNIYGACPYLKICAHLISDQEIIDTYEIKKEKEIETNEDPIAN